MKVTLFTGNQERHNYFINLLSDTATELNVIQENRTLFPGVVSGGYPQSDLMRDYFLKVSTAQKKIFCTDCIASKKKILTYCPWHMEIWINVRLTFYLIF